MIAVSGYYDGNVIQALEKLQVKKNQKLIITILDEFLEEAPANIERQSARGVLAQYANPELQKEEQQAWEKAVIQKYGND